MAAQRQITIQLKGSAVDAGDVRLEDFIEELSSVRAALRETERAVTGQDPFLYFRIADMRHDSPATVTLEAASETIAQERTAKVANLVVRHFTANLRFLSRKKRVPRTADVAVLESYREMTVPLQKHVAEVIVTAGKHSAVINEKFRETLERVLGPEERAYGSISGTIEAINVHDTTRFTLYPTVGPRKVLGVFKRDLRPKFTTALDKYVTVYGQIRYKTWDKYPYAVMAEDIEIHDESAPTLADIKGMAPGITGDLPSDEFIDRLRDETW